MVDSQMQALLEGISSADNALRKQSEAQLQEMRQNSGRDLFLNFMHFI